MKKLLYLLPVIVILFASCGPVLEPPVQIGPGIDTVFYSTCEYEVPVTAPRFDCKGNRLLHPKIVAWKKDTCVTVNHIGFNETYLNNLGYQYVGKPVSVGPVDPPNGISSKSDDIDFSGFPWEWLLGLAFAALLIIMLVKLAKAPMAGTPKSVVEVTTPSASTSSSSSTSGRSSTTETSSWTEETKMLGDIMKDMKLNDISDISAEFPNGPKITVKKDAGTKQSKVKKEEKRGEETQGNKS